MSVILSQTLLVKQLSVRYSIPTLEKGENTGKKKAKRISFLSPLEALVPLSDVDGSAFEAAGISCVNKEAEGKGS